MRKKFSKRSKIVAGVLVAAAAGVYTADKIAIRHERLPLVDSSRVDLTKEKNKRSVPVDVYAPRYKEMQAKLGTIDKLPVVIISHGNTLNSYEYSFVAKLFAARGYLALSVQHDLPGEPKLVTDTTKQYVGRLPSYERGSANIDFVVNYFKQEMPFADYDHLTLLGHSQGGDISAFYASTHPYNVKTLITFDNLRFPFDSVHDILTIRGNNKDNFTPDPGVVPDCENKEDKKVATGPETDDKKVAIDKDACEEGNLTIYWSRDHHTNLNDRGPESLHDRLTNFISRYLESEKSRPKRPPNLARDPAMGPEYRPLPAQPF